MFPYLGNNSVLVGNGASLLIAHTGFLPLNLGSRHIGYTGFLFLLLTLAPSLKNSLLFVSQFTKDNFMVVTIHHFGQVISIFYTGSPLFQDRCKEHLYPVSPSRFLFLVVPSSWSYVL